MLQAITQCMPAAGGAFAADGKIIAFITGDNAVQLDLAAVVFQYFVPLFIIAVIVESYKAAVEIMLIAQVVMIGVFRPVGTAPVIFRLPDFPGCGWIKPSPGVSG